jgi:uncharacterized protein (TIGR02996 family)
VDAVHDDPRNDAPRLAYADWLKAHGHVELSEFIRLQCCKPYFILDLGRDGKFRLSPESWSDIDDDDDRVTHALELLGRLHGSARFPDTVKRWEEYTRGLPLYQVHLDDGLKPSISIGIQEFCCGKPSPLARFRLSINTPRIADWLAQPFMRRVDVLRLYRRDAEDGLIGCFTAEDISLLEHFPLLHHLEELGMIGRTTDEAEPLIRERLEPKVLVTYEA